MIATGDIKNILMNDIIRHPMLGDIEEINKDIAYPVTESDNCEQIVISAGEAVNDMVQQTECFVEIFVPDVLAGNGVTDYLIPNHDRLTELENECIDFFTDEVYGIFGGSSYTYKLKKIQQEADPDTGCHLLYVSLIFEVINI